MEYSSQAAGRQSRARSFESTVPASFRNSRGFGDLSGHERTSNAVRTHAGHRFDAYASGQASALPVQRVKKERKRNRKKRTVAAMSKAGPGRMGAGGAVLGGVLGVAGAVGLGLAFAPAAAVIGAGALAGGLIGAAAGYGAQSAHPMDAESRVRRARARAIARRNRSPLLPGRYQHPLGTVSVSSYQMMAQTRKQDYGNATLGSNPRYSTIRANLPSTHAPAIYDPNFTMPHGASEQERAAAVLSAATTNISEESRAPGVSKPTRAAARAYRRNPAAPHPLSSDVNPAVSTAQEARDVLDDPSTMSASQRHAVDGYMSDSSDEEDGHFAEEMFDPIEE